ncbi:MAG: amino acid carrier protein [Flavobacteriales bacterium]|nr:amino acid carrier protein [Flavobacteriales bacterium]
MFKKVLFLLLSFSSFSLFATDFKAEIKSVNPSADINDGVAYVTTLGGVAPFTYKWSDQGTELSSSSCEGLTEGSSFSVLVTDAEGNKIKLEGNVKAESVEELINSFFVPVVDGMASLLFSDPFSAIGIYDPTVYADLKNVKAPGWSNSDIGKIVLKEWKMADGAKVTKRDFIAVITQNNSNDINVFANSDGILQHNIKEGKVIYDATNIDDVIEVGAENLASILYASPQAVLHPNGDIQEKGIPFIVVWLVLGAIFFTLKMKLVNIRGFKHAIQLVSGKFTDPNAKEVGEVSHFQALTTALSATVGLGNIAGVAVAITLGGPGATFWMIAAGLIGMSSKFVECTLGVKYRKVNEKGEVSGGPMYYLSEGLKKKNLGGLGKVLAVLFAILCIGGSFGGGNMFQANQAFAQLSGTFPSLQGSGFWFGIVLALLVGVVIIGGIKSIAKVTDKIVPFMAILYVAFSLVIIGMNFENIGTVLAEIFNGAFNAPAIKGGVIGVLIVGFQRAAFSNEAGVGSASIAHSASKTNEPVSEGIVALLEPFVDTVVVCTMTALVLVFTGFADGSSSLEGSELTSAAFGSVFPWFSIVLVVAIFLFAFSTMISWSYYGLKAWTYLLGDGKAANYSYKIIFCGFIIVGSSVGLGAVLDFSDLMILGMALPNIIGLIIMSKEVKEDMISYFERVKSGAIKKFK